MLVQSHATTCRWTRWRWQHCRGWQIILKLIGLSVRISHILVRSHATFCGL